MAEGDREDEGDLAGAATELARTQEGQPGLAATELAATRAAAARDDDAPIPERLGRYEILEILGAGGMGRVYRARDPQLGRDVAIKVLGSRAAGSGPARELSERLLREAQAMARLSHANLVTVHDVGRDGDDVFVAMELVAGETLDSWLRSHPGEWQLALELVLEAGRGLAAAHRAGVVHRDFKPANVFVGRDRQVKVGDFGLARAVLEKDQEHRQLGSAAGDPSLTVTGAVMGTPLYMSPEQHQGLAAGEASDQFSLGVTAYEAAYGQRPFAGDTLVDLARAASAGPGDEPPVGGRPAALFPILRRSLDPEPAARWASVADLVAALEAVLHPAPDRRRWFLLVGALGIALVLSIAVLALGDSERVEGLDPESTSGVLTTEQVRATVREYQPKIVECFDEELARNPDVPDGRVVIRFHIARDGRVVRTEVQNEDVPSSDLASCVGAVAMRFVFPEPDGDGGVVVTYPFNFSH